MKKLAFAMMMIAIFLNASNSALAATGWEIFKRKLGLWSPPKIPLSLAETLIPQIQEQTKLLGEFGQSGSEDELDKIYKSLTGPRTFHTTQLPQSSSSLFKDPRKFYEKRSDVTRKDQHKVQSFGPFNDMLKERRAIEDRKQIAAVVNKAVSLQTFEEADKRLKKIDELMDQIKTTQDIKAISDLQIHIDSELALIQNEITKLQTIAHLSKAERSLIRQKSRERHIKIVNSANTEMPKIRQDVLQ
ncbi:TrwJ protein [Bartonella australis AUST/NH1]|uniref:TrwJ protein n=1 Tax=Bartonella australis (strain Aust/NH1) TaxID=1094489 RepID=M1P0A7_BARAA|nr:type IV secretion system protein [Bartonella australis]AGF75072.1 TrwJ protein [Bartonella australis AUST/NH1]